MAKTVKIQGSFEVINTAKTVEAKKVLNDEVSIDEATQLFPQKILASQTDVQLSMGGVAQAKRVFLRSSQEVTLKLNHSTDDGFPFGPGDGIFCSYTGITAIYVTTGANDTELEAIITGS